MDKKKKYSKFTITELFLVKADWNRTYTGTIKREIDNGQPIVRGSVCINEGMIYCKADNEDELGKKMDEICVMKLDMGIHQSTGVFLKVCGNNYFLN